MSPAEQAAYDWWTAWNKREVGAAQLDGLLSAIRRADGR